MPSDREESTMSDVNGEDQISHSDKEATPDATKKRNLDPASGSDGEFTPETPKKKAKAKPVSTKKRVPKTKKAKGEADSQNGPSPRKGLTDWDKASDDLIISARKANMPWKELTERLNKDRETPVNMKAIKNRWDRHLRDRDLELSEVEMKVLVDAENFVKAQIYTYIVDKFKQLCKEEGIAESDGGLRLTKAACEKFLKAHH